MVNRLFVLAGSGAGLYMGILGLDIYRASQGERGLQAEAASERRLAAAAEGQAKREESAVAGIEHDVKQRQEAVETIDAEIAAVQQRLEELRELREARVKEAADAQAALDEARGRLVKLVQDARRHQQAATAAEAALTDAHKHTLEAKRGLNPLHHPLVRGFTGRSG